MALFTADEYTFDLAGAPTATTPFDAYTAWAGELGVSATGTDVVLDGDDFATRFPLAAPVVGTGLTGVFCTEGHLSFYREAPSLAEASRYLPYNGEIRSYALTGAPADFGVLFRPGSGGDLIAVNVRARSGGGVTIIRGEIRNSGGGASRMDFAARMSAGALVLVLRVPASESAAIFTPFGRFRNTPPLALAASSQQIFTFTGFTYAPKAIFASLAPQPPVLFRAPQPTASLRATLLPVRVGVEGGALKDYTSGVMGKGVGRVHGTVKLKGEPTNTPLRRKVWLLRQRDGVKIRETWSDAATGEYEFNYIDELQLWTVVSFDHTQDKRAVIADGLVPEVIE